MRGRGCDAEHGYGQYEGDADVAKSITFEDPIAGVYKKLYVTSDGKHLLGGMLVAQAQLDISYAMFADRMFDVLLLKTLLVGLFKAPVFAVFIALIACRMGLSVTRDARSVGANTTSTVVQCIVWVIVIDAAFAVLLQQLGI